VSQLKLSNITFWVFSIWAGRRKGVLMRASTTDFRKNLSGRWWDHGTTNGGRGGDFSPFFCFTAVDNKPICSFDINIYSLIINYNKNKDCILFGLTIFCLISSQDRHCSKFSSQHSLSLSLRCMIGIWFWHCVILVHIFKILYNYVYYTRIYYVVCMHWICHAMSIALFIREIWLAVNWKLHYSLVVV
jgi:hypothetical protein